MMQADNSSGQTTAATVVRILIGALVVFDGVSFLLSALLHLHMPIPLGFATIAEPAIPPAAVVEGAAGLLFALSAYAYFTHRTWAWTAAVAAHAFALAGVLLGMWAIAAGFGPHSPLNDTYHRVMLVVLGAGLALLLAPIGQAALGRGGRTQHGGA